MTTLYFYPYFSRATSLTILHLNVDVVYLEVDILNMEVEGSFRR